MKIFLISIALSFLFSQNIFCQYYNTRYPNFQYRYLDANELYLPLNNYGSAGNLADLRRFTIGEWDSFDGNLANIYDQGIWILGKIQNEVVWNFTQWVNTYSPGPIINGKSASEVAPEDSLRYRAYKITKWDEPGSSHDYKEWPADFGAPVNEYGYPVVYNDQMIWTVYNASRSSLDSIFYWYKDNLKPFSVEVRQIVHEKKSEVSSNDAFSNAAFFEWTIINKGNETIDSAFIGLWSDIDLFNWECSSFSSGTNLPAVDTVNQIGYLWSKIDSCGALFYTAGYVLLYGPAVPSQDKTSVFKGRYKEGFENLPLFSFWPIGDDSPYQFFGEIRSRKSAWNSVFVRDTLGNPILDPITAEPTKFPVAGDPLIGEGWTFDLYPGVQAIGGGAGFTMFTGPFTLAPQDTQWVMAAAISGIGKTYKESISDMRKKTAYLRSLSYDELVEKTSYKPEPAPIPESFELYQNYPNPFNATTNIRFDLPEETNVLLEIYNVLGEKLATLVDKKFEAGFHWLDFDGTNYPSGLLIARLATDKSSKTIKMLLLK